MAVEVAWADRELSLAERDWLGALEREFNLREYQVAEIERRIMGGKTKEEIELRKDELVEKVVYRVDPEAQYRAAVKIAWADGKLNKSEEQHLSWLQVDLGISGGQAEEIERGIMDGTREEIVSSEDDEDEGRLTQYHAAIEMAWADKKLNKVEEDYLSTLENKLGLGREQAGEIERKVMGSIKEEIELYKDESEVRIDHRVDHADHYRTAVEMAWADRKLNNTEKDRLSALEDGLGLSWDQAADIEREVMGRTKEEIKLYDGSSEGGEPWMKLVEECVEVIDELDRHMTSLDPQHQELADHVIIRLGEVLERSGVDVISDEAAFDSKRHRPERAGSRTSPGATIAETMSPGFAVGRRVLRRARVRVE
jgi:molecular chaperone GrpE (heat shock protein)